MTGWNGVMRSVELFTGCGGLAMGLAQSGFHHEAMVEFNDDAVETVKYNRRRGIKHVRSWPIECADVRTIDWRKYVGIDLVAGGPPCQPFSIGGKHAGHGDTRDMWPEAVRAIREAMPRAFLFENVKGLARPKFAEYLRWITAYLRHPLIIRRNGESHVDHLVRLEASDIRPSYRVRVMQVNAADFGAAQKRHRVMVVGMRSDVETPFELPVATHSRERLLWDQWVTGDYWRRHGLEQPSDHEIQRVDRTVVARLRRQEELPCGQPWVTVRDALADLGEPNNQADHVLQPGARSYPGHTGSPLDMPAKALKAGDHGVPGGENMMVRDDGSVRYFTIREAARLQGLPDTYRFPGCWTESMRQLGNAVPVQLAEVVGNWIGGTLARGSSGEKEAA